MTPLLLLCAALAADNVAVVGLEGSAPAPARLRAHGLLVDALRGVGGLQVVAIADPGAMLGPEAAAALAACTDDRCRVAVLGPVARGTVVLGSLETVSPSSSTRDGVARLDLRVATATAGTTVRVSRDLRGPLDGALRGVLIEVVGTLFPGRPVQPTSKLTVRTDVDGAAVTLDGQPLGLTPLPPIDARIGTREVAVSLPDGRRAVTRVELLLGSPATVELTLTERTMIPWILAGSAVLLAGGGFALGAVADGTASDWSAACPGGGGCATGFTRERYDSDSDSVAVQGTLATGLLIGAGAALVSAAVVWILEGSP